MEQVPETRRMNAELRFSSGVAVGVVHFKSGNVSERNTERRRGINVQRFVELMGGGCVDVNAWHKE